MKKKHGADVVRLARAGLSLVTLGQQTGQKERAGFHQDAARHVFPALDGRTGDRERERETKRGGRSSRRLTG